MDNPVVTIRRILLLAFLLVGVLPVALLTWLAFSRSEAALQAQIADATSSSARATGQDLSRFVQERAHNATTWNHLEVMQDLRLRDVDKRLSSFLAEMVRRYGGEYAALHAVDLQGNVVASSDPAALGTRRDRPQVPWAELALPGGRVRIDAPAPAREGRRLSLRVEIASNFGSGTLGELLLDIDWNTIEHVLDGEDMPGVQRLVLDAHGQVIAASGRLRASGFDLGREVAGWREGPPVQQRGGSPLMQGEVVVGRTRVPPTEWTALTLRSREVALAPIHRMGQVFAGLLAVISVLTVLASFGVSAWIARPVMALTQFTREYLRPGAAPLPPRSGPGEIGELGRSFVNLVEDLQRSQQTLAQASRLAALGEVTALMAHEVRTPLGILRSSAQMLRGEPHLSGEARELVDIVQSETERLNRLVSTMLDQTRMRVPVLQLTDAHVVVARAATLLAAQARERGVQVQLRCLAANALIDADAEQLTQVLLNLLGNAISLLPSGGRVEAGSRNEPGRLVIDVDDDGPGIPPEDRQRVFEPFVYKREGGLGLGLAVVRQIVRAHGGDVQADDSPLGGARLRLWIPQPSPHPA